MVAFSREKIALLVFCLLMVAGAVALAFYLFAGHSWNYAATSLDDSFGNMNDYAVVVFEGTVDPENDSAGAGGDEDATDTISEEAAGEAAGIDGIAADTEDAADVDKITDDTGEAEEGEANSSFLKLPFGSPTLTEKEPVTAEQVGKSYEEKGATVFVLDSTDIDRYAEGIIMQHGQHRIGVMSVSTPRPIAALERQVEYFEENGVDFVVALASNGAYLTGVSGIDVVIATDGDGSLSLGQTVNGAFRVYAPETGSVGAVLISPSNVVSAKVIDEL